MKLNSQETLSNTRISLVKEDVLLGIDGYDVLRKRSGGSWGNYISIKPGFSHGLVGRFDLTKRLFRGGIHGLMELPSGDLLVVTSGVISRIEKNSETVEVVHRFRRGRRPLKKGFTLTPQWEFIYGEYFSNEEREEVKLWKGFDGGRSWEPIYTFTSGTIRHVHATQMDPFTGNLWVTTGDKDEECRIGYSDPEEINFNLIGSGSQEWRAVSLVFTSDYVYWGTDNPKGSNGIYRWNRKKREKEKVADPIGPVYYGEKIGNYILFSTAVEKGEGEQDGYARVYGLDEDLELYELLRAKKDRWHPVLFGYGLFEFPRYEVESEDVWVVARGLETPWKSMKFRIGDN